MVNFEPALHYVSEWWKQLFGESEGKDQKGTLSLLLSISQPIFIPWDNMSKKDVENLFETVVNVKEPRIDITLGKEEADLDGLNYLSWENDGLCQ